MAINTQKRTRLYDFVAGTPAYSQQVDDEFNQLIEELGNTVDDLTTLDTNFANHKSSADHDGRYYQKSEMGDIINTHKNSAVIDHPDSSITTTKIIDNAITTYKIVDRAVTGDKIQQQAIKLEHLDPSINQQVDINLFNGRISTLENTVNAGATQNLTLTWGYNSIKNNGQISIYPTISTSGNHYVNLLGRDGNCDDTSKWSASGCTTSLDSSHKVFGANGINITLSSATGGIYNNHLITKNNMAPTKYYMLSAYLMNGNSSTGVRLTTERQTTGSGGIDIFGTYITDTAKFTRVCIRLQPSDFGTFADRSVGILVSGSSGQYGYVDGIMVNEITADEYNNMTDTDLMTKYPYIDSYGCTQNPYFENRRDNLVINGNAELGTSYWFNSIPLHNTFSVVNGKLTLTNDGNSGGIIYQFITVKSNTNYYLSGNKSGIYKLSVLNSALSIVLKDGVGTFNTGSNNLIIVALNVDTARTASTTYYDSIMLTEGTTAPSVYKPCNLQRFVVEGKFTSDDTITINNGQISGQLWWKHKTLYGKDYDWQFQTDYTGYKLIALPYSVFNGIIPSSTVHEYIKYDGKVLLSSSNYTTASDLAYVGGVNALITMADTDTGWAETINPNNDEVKAFMNGWKALCNNGTRYVSWASVIDGSVPAGTTQVSISATTSTTSLTVSSNGTTFVSGDIVTVVSPTGVYRGSWTVTGTPTATNIPLTATANVTSGDIAIKADNGSTNVSLLTWCKNNVAPGYEGYQLHYKLANPEPITDANVHIHGDMWQLEPGDNYINMDTGTVLGEVVTVYNDGTSGLINSVFNSNYAVSKLKNKVDSITHIYGDNVSLDSLFAVQTNLLQSYGNQYAVTPSANVNPNAIYTVDYKILRTIAPQTMGSVTLTYAQSVLNSILVVGEEVEQKQQHDSALDTLVDLSMYEIIKFAILGRANKFNTNEYRVSIDKYITPKKAIPIVTITNVYGYYFDAAGTTNLIPSGDTQIVVATVDTNRVVLQCKYVGSNTTIQSNITNNGFNITGYITLDCRGRI